MLGIACILRWHSALLLLPDRLVYPGVRSCHDDGVVESPPGEQTGRVCGWLHCAGRGRGGRDGAIAWNPSAGANVLGAPTATISD